MGPWFRQFEALIWAASIAVGVLIYALGAFATKEMVEQKHQSGIDAINTLRSDILEVKEMIRILDNRIFEQNRRNETHK